MNLNHNFKDYFHKHSEWLSKYLAILSASIILGMISGLVMVGFNYLLILFKFCFTFIPYFLAPLIAGALTSIIVKIGMKKKLFLIMGSGVEEFVSEVNTEKEINYNRISVLSAKTLATSWTFGSGMVCGKEGPGLLIGANLGHIISKKFKRFNLNLDDYYFIGASACTSAILKAPISGALFAAELPYTNHLRYRSLLPSIFASLIAFLVFSFFFKFSPLFETHLTFIEEIDYFLLLPLLIFFGIFAGIIIFFVINSISIFMDVTKRFFKNHKKYYYLPLIGAIFYSILLFMIIPFMDPDYYSLIIGPDFSVLYYISKVIGGLNFFSLLFLFIIFLIAMLFSIGFYNSSGIILPLMILGALIGGLFGVVFFPEYPELFVLLGISSVLGASIKNPITAIIILVEMTWEPFLFIPAGITTIITYIISGPNTIILGKRNVQELRVI